MERTRKELREEIIKSVKGIRNNDYLGMILEISEIFRKALDEKEYKELSGIQWKQRSAISEILKMNNEKDIGSVINVMVTMTRYDERGNCPKTRIIQPKEIKTDTLL